MKKELEDTAGTLYKLYKKQTGTLKKRFFNARMMDTWKELDEQITAVDMGYTFPRKLSEYGY